MKNGSAFVKDGDEIRCAICGNVCGKGRKRVRFSAHDVWVNEPGAFPSGRRVQRREPEHIWWFCGQTCRDRLPEVKSAGQVAECIAALKFG